MRLDELMEHGNRWDVDDLNFDVLSDRELQRIVDITEIDIQHDRDPSNRPMNADEITELNNICRKAATHKIPS